MTSPDHARREDLVKLLASNEHLIDRPAELATLILEALTPPRDPDLAHRLRLAVDAERDATDNWTSIDVFVAAREAVDALIEQVAR